MLGSYDPFRLMLNLRRDIDQMFDESPLRYSLEMPEAASVPLDIFEEGNNLMVKASVPGLKPEEIKVEVRGDVLHIFGEHQQEHQKKERNYHLKEHRYTRFDRRVMLPAEVLSEKASAVFENGMLNLTLPKAEVQKSKQIPIKTAVKV